MNESTSERIVYLDGSRMTDREQAHAQIADAFGFPSWYGRNLDALWDMLSTCDDVTVYFGSADSVPQLLGEYGDALLDTFREAAEENPRLHLHIEEARTSEA